MLSMRRSRRWGAASGWPRCVTAHAGTCTGYSDRRRVRMPHGGVGANVGTEVLCSWQCHSPRRRTAASLRSLPPPPPRSAMHWRQDRTRGCVSDGAWWNAEVLEDQGGHALAGEAQACCVTGMTCFHSARRPTAMPMEFNAAQVRVRLDTNQKREERADRKKAWMWAVADR